MNRRERRAKGKGTGGAAGRPTATNAEAAFAAPLPSTPVTPAPSSTSAISSSHRAGPTKRSPATNETAREKPGYACMARRDPREAIAVLKTVPSERAGFFSEKIVHLPGCYMVTSPEPIAGSRPIRLDCGLPEEGIVFASFCRPTRSSRRCSPSGWTSWAPSSARCSGSPAADRWPRRTWGAQATTRGIAPGRLIFADRVEAKTNHLARLGLADLGLDTRVFGGHTTTCDMLWAGAGDQYPERPFRLASWGQPAQGGRVRGSGRRRPRGLPGSGGPLGRRPGGACHREPRNLAAVRHRPLRAECGAGLRADVDRPSGRPGPAAFAVDEVWGPSPGPSAKTRPPPVALLAHRGGGPCTKATRPRHGVASHDKPATENPGALPPRRRRAGHSGLAGRAKGNEPPIHDEKTGNTAGPVILLLKNHTLAKKIRFWWSDGCKAAQIGVLCP